MNAALIAAVLSIFTVLVSLTTLLAFNRLWNEAVDGWRRTRHRVLEPIVLAWERGREHSLITALGGTARRRDRVVLECILLNRARHVRGAGHRRLAGAFEELGYVDRYLEALRSRHWWKRADAAEKLGLAGATRAAEYLAEAMRDESTEVRLHAARSLGLLGGEASARELIHALEESNRWSAIRVADILTGMGRKVVDELMRSFPSMSLPGQIAVLDVLGRIRPLRAAGWLVERLGDADPDVRARAAHALGCIGDPSRCGELIRALEDTEWPVRAMAAKALGRVHHIAAIPALRNALSDEEWWVRSNAAHALRTMGSRGLDALEDVLNSSDRFARHQAVLMLQEAGVVDEKVGRLAASDEGERRRATEFVRRLIAAGQLDKLSALAVSHVDKAVRLALEELLQSEQPEEAERARDHEPAEGTEGVEGTAGRALVEECGGKQVEQVAAAAGSAETTGDPGLVEGPAR
jgi:HEAT repeat protein